MNCIECQENVVDHQESLLDPPKRAEFEQHLDQCQVCRAEYDASAAVRERLLAHGQTAAGVAMANRVMSRIRQTQPEPSLMMGALARLWKWGLGFGAAAAGIVLLAVFFGSPKSQAMASEVMARGVQAARQLASVHIVCRVRTGPAENFGHIDPQLDFVTVNLWKQFGAPGQWRVEKPGRVAVMDGQSTILFLRPANAALKVPQATPAAFDTGWLHEMANIEGTLETELRLAVAKGWKMELSRQNDNSGAAKAIVAIEARSRLPEGDYLKNKFFGTADTRRVYRFDDRTGALEAVQVYLHDGTSDSLILEVDQIEYNQAIDPATFQLVLPENVSWIQEPKPQADDAQIAAMTASEVARAFFEACGREDWETVAKFWQLPLDNRIKGYLGGLKLVSLGEPFTSAASRAKFVPYEIQLRSGDVKKHNLALKQRSPTGRWFVDGGL